MATKKKSSEKKVAESATTRCEQGLGEFAPGEIEVKTTDHVELVLTLCKSPFRIIVYFAGVTLFKESGVQDELRQRVAPLAPGRHQLHWVYVAANQKWQVKSEVVVNGETKFLTRKSDQSTYPTGTGFTFLEVS